MLVRNVLNGTLDFYINYVCLKIYRICQCIKFASIINVFKDISCTFNTVARLCSDNLKTV